MTTETMTLIDFLLARIAEDEAIALDQWGASWSSGYGVSVWNSERTEYGNALVAECPGAGGPGMHIARHDPARVLGECKAKRRIVEHCQEFYAATESDLSDDQGFGWWQGIEVACKHLASVFADHPEYRQEWKP